MNKLALGTAQFGVNYGISNNSGKIKLLDAKKILRLAKKEKIDLIDTAISYGDSENIIGETNILDFKFVSKLPKLPRNCNNVYSWVKNNILASIKKLRIKSIYGFLFHQSKDLLGAKGNNLIDAINQMKFEGLIKKVGLSIYDPSEMDLVMPLTKFDIIQAPVNIIDQRFKNSGWMIKLHQANIEIHSRSVFLQGLLLMSQKKRPNKFDRWSFLWKIWHEWLNDNKLTPLQASIRYAVSIPEITKVIVGVDTKEQLEQIIIASNGLLPKIPSELNIDDVNLLNPYNWGKL